MTEYLFDHDRHARDQWCPGIAGEYSTPNDYEHEHRVAEHEHDTTLLFLIDCTQRFCGRAEKKRILVTGSEERIEPMARFELTITGVEQPIDPDEYGTLTTFPVSDKTIVRDFTLLRQVIPSSNQF